MQYWLFKKEPKNISIDDIEAKGVQNWHGVRNYQARNYIRSMEVGDLVLVYHSNSDPSGVVGIARVCSEAYDDVTAQDPTSYHPDPKATAENPIWSQIDIAFVERFPQVLSLADIKQHPQLEQMLLLRPGQRLSIQPVTEAEFTLICSLARQ
jgi:predicted RNA-binding protein with PUA-like domain